MSKNIKTETYYHKPTINNYYSYGAEPEPHTEVLLNQSHDDSDSIAEADTEAVKQRTFSERNYPDTALKNKLLLALKGASKAYRNQEELRAVVQSDYTDMKSVLTNNPKLFSYKKGANGAGIWYLTKRGKRLKRKLLKQSLSADKGTSIKSTQGKNS